MAKLGVLIGSSPMPDQEALGVQITTPWGEASAIPTVSRSTEHEMVFLHRHGAEGQINPHQIN